MRQQVIQFLMFLSIILCHWDSSVEAKGTLGSRTGRSMSSTQQWNCLMEEGGWDGALANAQQIDAIGGTFSRLRVKLSGAPGAGNSYVFKVQKGGTNQSITCTISGASATSCTDLADTFTTSAGNLVNITKTATGSPPAVNGYYSIIWTGAAVQDPLFGGYVNNALDNSIRYLAIEGCNSNATLTEVNASQLVATGGTLKNFYVDLASAPGAGNSRILTLMQNEVASAMTCTVSGTATTCNDTVNTVTLAAGDRLSIKATVTGTPASTSLAHYGFQFVPTIEGESLFMMGAGGNPLQPSTTATNYASIVDDTNWNATETNVQTLAQTSTIKGLYVNLSVAPNNGAGVQSYAFTVEKNGAATNITCTVSEAATTCSDTTDTATVVDDDLLGIKCVPSGTPAATNVRLGTVSLIKRRYYTSQ